MNLSIAEGSSTGGQARRSTPAVHSRNKRPIVSFPWGAKGWPGKRVAIVTVTYPGALGSVHKFCQESARSKSALESTEALLNQLQLAELLFS